MSYLFYTNYSLIIGKLSCERYSFNYSLLFFIYSLTTIVITKLQRDGGVSRRRSLARSACFFFFFLSRAPFFLFVFFNFLSSFTHVFLYFWSTHTLTVGRDEQKDLCRLIKINVTCTRPRKMTRSIFWRFTLAPFFFHFLFFFDFLLSVTCRSYSQCLKRCFLYPILPIPAP